MVLYLQRKCGSRFFIPKFCRFWNEYDYYKDFSEDLEEGNNSEGANTCCICLNPLSFMEDQPQQNFRARGVARLFTRVRDYSTRRYMKTPCGHKYHIQCLKSWMRRKLECPFCRASIPPLDEEEDE
jgi:transmembrane E3 ubiquitin-protein ligase